MSATFGDEAHRVSNPFTSCRFVAHHKSFLFDVLREGGLSECTGTFRAHSEMLAFTRWKNTGNNIIRYNCQAVVSYGQFSAPKHFKRAQKVGLGLRLLCGRSLFGNGIVRLHCKALGSISWVCNQNILGSSKGLRLLCFERFSAMNLVAFSLQNEI